MIALLSFRIDTTSIQKLTALREKCAALLEEDDDVTLISKNSAEDEDHDV